MKIRSLLKRVTLVTLSAGALIAGNALAGPVQVDLATPSAGEQATVQLEVTIDGNGFDEGSEALFLVSGTANPGGIVVTNNQFVSRKQLVATIDIAPDADLDDYDIEVMTSSGRRGKGHTLFRVVKQGSLGGGGAGGGPEDRPGDVSLCAIFQDGAGDAIVSDNGSAYCDEMDGVWIIPGLNGNFTAGELGSKKFNPNQRDLYFKSDCGGIVDPVCDPVSGWSIDGNFWAAYEYDTNGNPVGNDRLQWLEMSADEVTRVSVHVHLGKVSNGPGPKKSRSLSYGNTNGIQIGCTADAPGTGPAWISCNSEDAGGYCNAWTLSSFDLSGGSNDALACFKREGAPDVTIDAPFAVEIFTMP